MAVRIVDQQRAASALASGNQDLAAQLLRSPDWRARQLARAALETAAPAPGEPVGDPLTISGTPDTAGNEGQSDANWTATAAGGTAPYVYSVQSGALAPGQSLNATTGAVTGVLTTAGVYPAIVIRVTDALLHTADLPGYTVTVTAIPPVTLSIFGTPDTAGTEGSQNANWTASATGGTAPYTFSVQSGALPTGQSLNPATGQVAGVLTLPGVFSGIVIRVTDSATPTPATADLAAYAVTVAATSSEALYQDDEQLFEDFILLEEAA